MLDIQPAKLGQRLHPGVSYDSGLLKTTLHVLDI